MIENKWYGIDVDLEISLVEYHLVGKRECDSMFFYYYDYNTESYQSCYLKINDIDIMINDLSYDLRKTLCDSLSMTIDEILLLDPLQKVFELLYILTPDDIFGCSYFKGLSDSDVLEIIKKGAK